MENILQTKNPKSGKYIKIDISKGKIIAVKKSKGPYKRIKMISARETKGEV